MKFHDTLNDKIWDLNTEDLIPEVKEKLEEIAEAFIEFLEIPTDAVLDKVITGSSASYNYNKYSDLDLHIIVDYDKVHEDCPLVNGYLNSLKKQFNDNHDITIHGVPVELYAEQKDQGTVHNGLYSLQTGWIDKPQKIEPTDNDAAVEAKFNEIKELVDKCDDSEEATELLEKIYNMRKAGLAEAGEFCTENLAFKKLRNEGCMDKLREIKKKDIDKQLSLESYNESDDDLTNFCIIIDGDYNWLKEYGTFKSCKAAQEWLNKNGEEDWMYSQLTKGEMNDLGIDEFGHVNESIKETLTSGQTLTIQGIWNAYEHGLVTKERTLQRYEEYLSENNMAEGDLIWAIGKEKWDHLHNIMTGNPELDDESIEEDYEEDDCEDCPEEMHKERYVTYFETPEGRQKYTIYHVYTDSTDDSYNELCDKRDNQLGMYNSYKELKDALKERAEKIAKQQGWTVKSIENLGEDDTYYRERNKFESIKEGFNKGDKVQLKRKNNKIGIVKSIFNGDKDKNDKDIKYLDVEFEDGTKEGRPASDFKKVNESLNEGQSIKKWAQSMLPEIFKLLRRNGIPSKDYCVLGHVEICPNANFLVRKTDVEKVLELLPMAKENEYWDTKGNAASIRIEYDGLREFEKTLKSVNEEYKAGDEITIDGKTGVIDSTFRFAEDDSLLGVWVKFGKEVKYYTLEELNDKSKNEDKEMNEDIKTEYAIINFLKKYGFATQEDLYNNIGAQVFVIDNAVKELLKQDKIKFEDGQGQDGINGWKLTEQIEEDLATLEKKVDKAEQDIQDIIASYTTNESIFDRLNNSFRKALDEEVEIDSHNFTFKVKGDVAICTNEIGHSIEIGLVEEELEDKDNLEDAISEQLDSAVEGIFTEEGEITGTEIVGFKYNPETKEGEFEFNIFFE